ncbi:uncharacterized protein BYT42DRAFT_281537 [Radiomyces spectabilis]|uniref:uncharacterized protein n=1 Tax=Radiomyces spectabilis TaxID=64574 RepID=UPI002220D4C8|nr:uncharacterized protein BYT42DRAFT_281537 [Radiomyces spectabilis]KAI8384969.1 hypothetical protein BYT42DRAFT_281537 [Radiomyces spectabilis]
MNLNHTHVTANPIVLTSVIIATIGWFVAFVGSCIAGLRGVSWWIIIYELLLLLGLFLVLWKSVFHHYRILLSVFLAVSIVLLTSYIDAYLYMHKKGTTACAAGAVMMIIMQFFWVFMVGSTEESWVLRNIYGLRASSSGTPSVVTMQMQQHGKESAIALSSAAGVAPIGGYPYHTGSMNSVAPTVVFDHRNNAVALHSCK